MQMSAAPHVPTSTVLQDLLLKALACDVGALPELLGQQGRELARLEPRGFREHQGRVGRRFGGDPAAGHHNVVKSAFDGLQKDGRSGPPIWSESDCTAAGMVEPLGMNFRSTCRLRFVK